MSRQQIPTAMILDGTIATVDLANAAVTNAKLASDVARANLLTNGGFEIWQRGNGPFASSFAADRWAIQASGGDTFSISRDSANAEPGGQYCAAVTFTGSAGSNLAQLVGVGESQVIRGRVVSISVRLKTSTANAVRLRLNDQVAGVQESAFHSGSGQYETLSLTYTIASSGALNLYCLVRFLASCTAYVDNAMLVVGSVAADYVPLHPADDLARCLRYYEVLDTGYRAWNSSAGSQLDAFPRNFMRKAVVPTITKGTWSISNLTGQPTISDTTATVCSINATSSAGGNTWYSAGTLAIEANP
jgi:hypothetical protein